MATVYIRNLTWEHNVRDPTTNPESEQNLLNIRDWEVDNFARQVCVTTYEVYL